jgi:hypothetical protein
MKCLSRVVHHWLPVFLITMPGDFERKVDNIFSFLRKVLKIDTPALLSQLLELKTFSEFLRSIYKYLHSKIFSKVEGHCQTSKVV